MQLKFVRSALEENTLAAKKKKIDKYVREGGGESYC